MAKRRQRILPQTTRQTNKRIFVMQRNTPHLWDNVWKNPPTPEQDRYELAVEESSIRWQRIEQIVRTHLGGIEGRRVIEIGAGAGTNAALMAKRGAQVTLLDYSERALVRARDFFANNDLRCELVQANALALLPQLCAQFDIAMSFGLAEHFTGTDRVQIFQSHLDALKPGGIAFVSVPNAFCPPYRLFKWVAQTSGRWKLGEEHPFSRGELEKICAQLGVTRYSIFGDSFPASFGLINPVHYWRKHNPRPKAYDRSRIRRQQGTPLDAYLGYALVLWMCK